MNIIEYASYVAAPTCGKLFAENNTVYRLNIKDPWQQYRYAYKELHKNKVVVNDIDFAQGDIFITNFQTKRLQEIGYDYETLHKQYPNLIYGHMLGYPDGKKGFDHTAFWAESGLMDMMQTPITPPWGVGDTIAGLLLYSKLLTAKPGEYITVSLYETGKFITEQHKLIGFPYPLPFPSPYGNPFIADNQWFLSDGKQTTSIKTLEGKNRISDKGVK